MLCILSAVFQLRALLYVLCAFVILNKDYLTYLLIHSQELQLDLDNVCSWASRWQMKFNVSKCKVIHYEKSNLGYKYSMENVPVEEADCEKDLGVTFTTDLKTGVHCKDVYSKNNRMSSLLSRTI